MILEVNRSDFRQTRVVDTPHEPLQPGQVRIRIERFALTANNISYALTGDLLGYWGFFPAVAGWGRIPAMGYGEVVESANDGIDLGGRYFGFYPMADDVVIDAEARPTGFVDVGAHRAGHAGAYLAFDDVHADAAFREDRADEFLLVRGLFMTSYLMDDFLGENEFFGATRAIITSASSKTSMALAKCLAVRDASLDDAARIRTVGLTSAGRQEFVAGLGLYDEVASYEDIESIDTSAPSVLVDMAGDAEVLSGVHHHLGDSLRYSGQVGATHWERMGAPADLPGPTPTFFFAPSQLKRRSDDWGRDAAMARIGSALAEFLEDVPRWITVEHSAGPVAVARIYLDTLEGRASASAGHILSMAPTAFGN